MSSRRRLGALLLAVSVGTLLARPAFAASGAGNEVLLPVLEALVLVIVGARLGGSLFAWLRLPPVLGELCAGIALGQLAGAGLDVFAAPTTQVVLDTLAQIGVLFLLFSVGLESDLGRMRAVAASAGLVAMLGVVGPMGLGWLVSAKFQPQAHPLTHLFVGATLAATSVGITARVLRELRRVDSREGRIILGAAVLDDVLGLVVLAAVTAAIEAAGGGAAFSAAQLLPLLARAGGFLLAAIVLGGLVSRTLFAAAARMRGDGVLLSVALAFCFGLAFLAGRAGLAPIVGAFAGGLVLEKAHYRELLARDGLAHDLESLFGPLSAFLVPVFFVLMGMKVSLAAFARPELLMFAAALTLAAIVGKQACSLGVLDRRADRIAVGLGMIPRGEVGLIFAGIGGTLRLDGERVVDDGVFSAIVLMVVVTTLLTPPLLAWRLRRLPEEPFTG